MKCITLLLILYFIGIQHTSICQTPSLAVNEWAKKLADPNDKMNNAVYTLIKLLPKLDSATVFNFLNQLNQRPAAKGNYFLSRHLCLQVVSLVYFNKPSPEFAPFKKQQIKLEVKNLLSRAMQLSYETNDDYLTAMVSGMYGNFMYVLEEKDLAVMYMMYSAELYDKINLAAPFSNYIILGEMLWQVREYEKSIKYSKKGINVLNTSNNEFKDSYTMTCSNTIALAYHRMGQYDSAFLYYGKALETEQKIHSPVWKGIISGNMAQIYFAQENYTAALPLFDLDYNISKEKEIYDNAANSLQWAAKTNLALGNKLIALFHAAACECCSCLLLH